MTSYLGEKPTRYETILDENPKVNKLDWNHARFVMQASISITTLIFSFSQIVLNNKDNTGKDNSVYFSLISSIMGYWLPSPKLPSKK